MQLDKTDNYMDYNLLSNLVLENNHNKRIEHSMPVISNTSHIRINTETLNIFDTYSCCLVMISTKQKNCSALVISPYISSHFTTIARKIGLLEMLILVWIFSLCLMCSVMRFKSRHQNKVIEANLQEIDSLDLEKFGSGPYIVTPNAQALNNNVSNSANDLKSIVLQDAKSADIVTDGDFPPSYEELVIRRMSQKITPVKY